MGDGKFAQSDLAGNVAEWVLDWNEFGDGACLKGKNTTTDCADIAAMGPSSPKLQRGGSFLDGESMLRSSFSIGGAAVAGYGYYGFRCGRAP
jgi:formylglycine-generating enzyme required for sulfatase activity